MDSASTERPLRDALSVLVEYHHTDEELCKLLIQMGDGRAAAAEQTTEWRREDEFWEVAADEEDSAVLVAPAPIYPAASVGPTSFTAWAAQGLAEAEKIRAVFAAFASANEESVCEFLSEITASKEGGGG